MQSALSAGEIRLRFPIAIQNTSNTLVIDDGKYLHRFADVSGWSLFQLLSNYEAFTPKDAVKQGQFDQGDQHQSLIRYSVENGILVSPVADNRCITGSEFADYLKLCYSVANDQMFSHELWVKLSNGTASESLVNGWLIETYFFIKGANARLPYAIGNCTSDKLRHALLHHYLEEWDHYGFFEESIRRRGLSSERVEERGPIPATKAVMLFARQAARESSLGYLACSGLLESTGSDSSKAREFYNAVSDHYDPGGTGFVAPMLKHIDLDEEYEHGDLMAEALGKFDAINKKDADVIVNILRGFTETLVQWFDEIIEYYDREIDIYGVPVSNSINYRVFK